MRCLFVSGKARALILLKKLMAGSAQTNDTASDGDDEKYHELFSEADGDIILKSGDGVLFKTHSFTLRRSATFFRDLLALPQPSASSLPLEPLHLEEKSTMIIAALLMIYGMSFPPDMVCMRLIFSSRLITYCNHLCIVQ